MMQLNDVRKIGIWLTAFGVVCCILGVLMFFDKGLLSIGNILFIVGLSMTIGLPATGRFFLRKRNQKGSAFFLLGAAFVLYGWAIIGLTVELYGFWLLFSGFFPTVL